MVVRMPVADKATVSRRGDRGVGLHAAVGVFINF
jgi:hypothetical protein